MADGQDQFTNITPVSQEQPSSGFTNVQPITTPAPQAAPAAQPVPTGKAPTGNVDEDFLGLGSVESAGSKLFQHGLRYYHEVIDPTMSNLIDQSPVVGQIRQVSEFLGKWAPAKAAANRQENLKAIAAGLPAPHSEWTNMMLGNLGSYAKMEHGASDPQNLALTGAAMTGAVPAAVVSGYMVGKGAQAVGENIKDAFGGNPDAAEKALMGGAQVAGGAAGLEEFGTTAAKAYAKIPKDTPVTDASFSMLNKVAADAHVKLASFKSAVAEQIGKDVDVISNRDVLDTARNPGATGSMKASKVNDALIDGTLDKFPGRTEATYPAEVKEVQKLINDKPAQMSWEAAKDLRTQVGNVLYRTKAGGARAVVSQVYGTLTKMMENRAVELDAAGEFDRYNDLTRNMADYEHGAFGKLNAADSGLDFMRVVNDRGLKPELKDLQADMAKFGFEPNFFDALRDSTKSTFKVASTSAGGGGFMGRMRAFAEHPVVAVPAGVAAGAIAYHMGMGMSFIAAMLAAGKAATMADKFGAIMEMHNLGGIGEESGRFGNFAPSTGGATRITSGNRPGGQGGAPTTALPGGSAGRLGNGAPKFDANGNKLFTAKAGSLQ